MLSLKECIIDIQSTTCFSEEKIYLTQSFYMLLLDKDSHLLLRN